MRDYNLIHDLREGGIDWNTIAETIEWFTDNDRKVYAGWLLGQEENNNFDLIKQAKKSQAIRLASKNLGLERAINNEQIRDISLHQTFTKQVLDAIENRYTEFDIGDSSPSWNIDKINEKQHHIFTTADFHYSGDVDYLDVIKVATEKITGVIRENNIPHIYLFELGDIIEGASLRTSQLMGVKSGMVNQVLDVADAYIKMISKLSEYADVSFFSVDSSNHTQLRNLGTKQNQLVEEDLMLVFNNIIRKALPMLDMTTGDDIYTEIGGYKFFLTHGHLIKNKEKFMEKISADRNILIDYTFAGHFHHTIEMDLHSACGYDKKVFYVPALQTKFSGYEKDFNMSSLAGVGYYVFEEGKGHTQSRKLVVE
jgi:hypothetical protein